jgi:hypothetical protein
MQTQAERSAKAPERELTFSAAAVARAQRMLGAEKPSQIRLPLFTVIAGLMADHLIKKTR